MSWLKSYLAFNHSFTTKFTNGNRGFDRSMAWLTCRLKDRSSNHYKVSYQTGSCCRNPSVNWDPVPCGLPGLWNTLWKKSSFFCYILSKVCMSWLLDYIICKSWIWKYEDRAWHCLSQRQDWTKRMMSFALVWIKWYTPLNIDTAAMLIVKETPVAVKC